MNTPNTNETASAQPENVRVPDTALDGLYDHISFLNYALIEAREERDKAQAERDAMLDAALSVVKQASIYDDVHEVTEQKAMSNLRAAIAQVEGK